MVHSVRRVFSPGKRPVVPYKGTGHGKRLVSAAAHSFYNDGTRIFLISAFRFFFRKRPCAGDIPIKIIRMGRTEGRNIESRLGKSCGIDGMGMCHTSDFRKRAVQRQVGLRIGRRFPFPFHCFSRLRIDCYHVARCHALIRHT